MLNKDLFKIFFIFLKIIQMNSFYNKEKVADVCYILYGIHYCSVPNKCVLNKQTLILNPMHITLAEKHVLELLVP